MRRGKELILATKAFAKEDRTQSWVVLLSTMLVLLGLLAIIIVAPLWLKIPASILYGLTLVRMFIIYHDFLHHTILHKSPIATGIMTVFGLYILAPVSIWKRSHDYHHQHNSKLFSASIGSYPVASLQKYLSMSRKERFVYLAVRHPLTISLAYFTMFIYGMCISSFISSPKRHFDSLLSLIVHIGASVATIMFLGWQIWLLAFLVPFIMSSAIGAYLFYAQHNFPGVSFHVNKEWAYEKAAMESSSYMVMNRVMAWFTGNIGYHHIHHLNSRIPFYRLPETFEHFPELQGARTTSLSPRDVWRCLRLKVWDPESQSMIGHREIERVMKAAS